MTLPKISWSKIRERGGGMLFALGLNGLLLLALLTLAPRLEPPVEDPRHPVTFAMAPASEPEKDRTETKEKSKEEPAPKRKAKRPAPPAETVQKPVEELPSPFILLNSRQMASADIGRMPKKEPDEGSSGRGSSAAVAGPGEGPGGVQLFEAEWYRKPTHAELATYLPADAPPSGWGLVACKTIENFQVENCQVLGESPAGSGFARAVRLAAWQFRVRPPRVDGKSMVGSWVRIRIDYSRAQVGARGAGM